MKKNMKMLIGAGIGIAVLAVITAVLLLTAPQTDTESSASSDDPATEIISVDADDISTLSIKNDADEYTIKRLGVSKWGIDEIPEDYADSSLYQSTMTSASAIKSKMTAEENVTDYEKYGFNDPTATFSMTFKDEKYESVTFLVGIHSDGENAWYFMKEGETTVYLVSDSSLTFSQYNMLTYINSSAIVPAYDSENDVIQRVRISRKDLDKDIVIDRLPDKPEDQEFADIYVAYKATSHNVLIDDEKGVDTVYGLLGISASYAYALKPDKEKLAECGLDSPQCTVSVVNNEDVIKLTIGDPIYRIDTDEETGASTKTITGYYGMIQGTDVIYAFPPEKLPWLELKLEDILYRLFITPYIYYLDDVTVTNDQGETYTFVITGDSDSSSVSCNGEQVDIARFKIFYQYLLSSYAEQIYTGELTEENKFLASFKYNYRDEDKQDELVEIYTSESDRTCIFVINGVPSFKIRQMYGTRLVENLDALLNGGTFRTDF